MRLKRWYFVSFVAACIAVVFGVQGTATEPEASANASSQEEYRTWTDRSGKFHAEAILVEFTDRTVTLKKKDGTTVIVPLEHLSDADQYYVEAVEAFSSESRDEIVAPGSQRNDSSARGDDTATDDEGVRTGARGDASTRSRARSSYRTAARTTARTTVGSSNTQGTRQVVVDGVGATSEEALKDAFRKAVSEVMGSIMNAETQVENDRLLVDRILTLTDGFVDSYEEAGKAYVENGLVHRRIVATVGRDSLLVACGRAESASVDASGLYAEVMTKLERRRNARALLRKTLNMLPGALLQVQVGRPPIEKLEDTTTALGIQLDIRVDPKKYEAFQDRMTKILRCLSKQDGTIEAYSSPVAQAWEPSRQQLLRKKFVHAAISGPGDMCVVNVDFADIEELSVTGITGLLNGSSHPPGQKGGASLFIKGQSDWRWFDLDEDVEWSPMMATVVVAFRDSDGEEVKTASLPLGPWGPGFAAPLRDNAGVAPRAVFMSPLFLYYHSGDDYPKIVAAKSVTVRGGITLENELLSRVNTVNASVRTSTYAQPETFGQEFRQTERGLRRTPPAPPMPEEDLARRAFIAQRSRAIRAAASARLRAHNAQNEAAFQNMWRSAVRRSGW